MEKRITIKMDSETIEMLDDWARRTGRNRSSQIDFIIRRELGLVNYPVSKHYPPLRAVK